ncbi:MAG: trimeric intracellular cation channel family protein [Xanthomonadales bacterium]|nr:trimeric intracellular cation channel family protein [Xanthomonadales bacterium]
MSTTFLVALDLMGTFVFAISGATVGVRHRLDLFGVLVLSFAAATCGGIVRDALIGATPPASLEDWRYLLISSLAGLLVFYRHASVERLRNPVQMFDAAGLGLFAVTGASKALAFGAGPLTAILLGMLSGIGGGIARDVLVAQIPAVLTRELYAIAALAGAAVLVLGRMLFDGPLAPLAAGGALLCFSLRLAAIRLGWGLPIARPPED